MARTKPVIWKKPSKLSEEYLRFLKKVLASFVADGTISQEEAAEDYVKAQEIVSSKGVGPDRAYWKEFMGQSSLVNKTGGRPSLYMTPEGNFLNREGFEVSPQIAQWMTRAQGATQESEVSPLESSLDAATTAGLMGRKVAWLEGQKRELAGLQSPRDWITRWQTQYRERPSFKGVTPWSMLTPEERGAELSKGEWGDSTWAQLASGYRSKADYEAAIGRARELGTEPFMEGTVAGPEPASFEGGGGKKEGNYTSPNAPKRTGPPVPDWITRYVPSLRGGVGLFKQDPGLLPTPSPYQMAQLNPSQQQQLAGYWDWYQGLNSGKRADVEARYQGRPYGTLREMSEAQRFSKLNPPMSWDDIMAQAERVLPRGIPGVRRRGALRQT